MSTVKGLRLINEGRISGVSVKKITTVNKGDLDSLNLSQGTKIKLRDEINKGNIIYVPSSPYTYESWHGLVYVNLDPEDGDGGYIIGEGLNGGYTVGQWLANWLSFWQTGLITKVEEIV